MTAPSSCRPDRAWVSELDRDKVDFYHRYFLEHQEVNEFYDPYRPGWVPALPMF